MADNKTMTRVTPPDAAIDTLPHNVSRNPGVVGGTVPPNSQSGYEHNTSPMRPVDPLAAQAALGPAVPVASESGRQEGRVAPAERSTVAYEAVSSSEAERRAYARTRGEMPPIEGGLDGPGVTKKSTLSQYDDSRMERHDGSGAETIVPPPPVAVQPVAVQPAAAQPAGIDLNQLAGLLAMLPQPAPIGVQPVQSIPEPVSVEKSAHTGFLAGRERVQLQIENAGTYSVPAIDVLPAGFGLFVLLPAGENDATFVPNAGSAVRVTFKGQTRDCYFPGVAGEIPALQILVLAMIDRESAATVD